MGAGYARGECELPEDKGVAALGPYLLGMRDEEDGQAELGDPNGGLEPQRRDAEREEGVVAPFGDLLGARLRRLLLPAQDVLEKRAVGRGRSGEWRGPCWRTGQRSGCSAPASSIAS